MVQAAAHQENLKNAEVIANSCDFRNKRTECINNQAHNIGPEVKLHMRSFFNGIFVTYQCQNQAAQASQNIDNRHLTIIKSGIFVVRIELKYDRPVKIL